MDVGTDFGCKYSFASEGMLFSELDEQAKRTDFSGPELEKTPSVVSLKDFRQTFKS